MAPKEKVTIGVINYNGVDILADTLQAIRDLEYPDYDVIVVDNHSMDGSLELLSRQFPEVRVICLPENFGSPGARNVVLNEARTDYVLIMDNDMVLEPDTLTRLMRIMLSIPQVAACHPEICDPNDPHVYHYNGGWISYLAALVSRPEPLSGQRPEYEVFDVVSGGALLLDRRVALQVGGFDADLFFNMEDGDFTARLTLAGYQCVNVPAAIAHHRSKPRGTAKVFYQTRNRWHFVLKLYSWRTLLLIAPILALHEVFQAFFLFLKGAGRDYLEGNLAVIIEFKSILNKRKEFQRLKVKRDQEWLNGGAIYVPQALIKGKKANQLLKLYSIFVGLYWKLIQPLCSLPISGPPAARVNNSGAVS